MRLWCLFLLPAATFVAAAEEAHQVLARRCAGCHGAAQQMASLRVDDVSSMLGRSVIVPGANDSVLIQRVTSDKAGFRMPPAGPRLTPEEVATLRTWIDAGAKAPAASAPVKTAARPRAYLGLA